MECIVCGGPAEQMDSTGDYKGWLCPECGRYRVSGTMLSMLRGRRFDLKKTRTCLQERRKASSEPMLTSHDTNLLVSPTDQV